MCHILKLCLIKITAQKKTIKSSLQYSPHRPAAFAGSSGSPCDALQHVGSSQAASFPMTYLGS